MVSLCFFWMNPYAFTICLLLVVKDSKMKQTLILIDLKFASLRRGVAQGNSLAASLHLTEKPVSKAHEWQQCVDFAGRSCIRAWQSGSPSAQSAGKEAVLGDGKPLPLASPQSSSQQTASSPFTLLSPLSLVSSPSSNTLWALSLQWLDLWSCTFRQCPFVHRKPSNTHTELVKADHFLNPNCLKGKETLRWRQGTLLGTRVRHTDNPRGFLDLLNPLLDATQASCTAAG